MAISKEDNCPQPPATLYLRLQFHYILRIVLLLPVSRIWQSFLQLRKLTKACSKKHIHIVVGWEVRNISLFLIMKYFLLLYKLYNVLLPSTISSIFLKLKNIRNHSLSGSIIIIFLTDLNLGQGILRLILFIFLSCRLLLWLRKITANFLNMFNQHIILLLYYIIYIIIFILYYIILIILYYIIIIFIIHWHIITKVLFPKFLSVYPKIQIEQLQLQGQRGPQTWTQSILRVLCTTTSKTQLFKFLFQN